MLSKYGSLYASGGQKVDRGHQTGLAQLLAARVRNPSADAGQPRAHLVGLVGYMREEDGPCAAATEFPLAPGMASFPCSLVLVLLGGASGHDRPGPIARSASATGASAHCPRWVSPASGLWQLFPVLPNLSNLQLISSLSSRTKVRGRNKDKTA